jgi:hypothetical protein
MGVTQNKEMTMSITSKESLLMKLVFFPLRSERFDLDLTLRRKGHKAKPCIHES